MPFHERNESLAQEQWPEKIGFKCRSERVGLDVDGELVIIDGDRGIVYENIEPAKFILDESGKISDAGGIRHVKSMKDDLQAFIVQFRACPRSLLLIAGRQDDWGWPVEAGRQMSVPKPIYSAESKN